MSAEIIMLKPFMHRSLERAKFKGKGSRATVYTTHLASPPLPMYMVQTPRSIRLPLAFQRGAMATSKLLLKVCPCYIPKTALGGKVRLFGGVNNSRVLELPGLP